MTDSKNYFIVRRTYGKEFTYSLVDGIDSVIKIYDGLLPNQADKYDTRIFKFEPGGLKELTLTVVLQPK